MSFMKKSKRNLFLLGALALALVITGGLFAGAWFSTSASDSVTWQEDFASVSAAELTILPSDISGGTWGNVTAQDPVFTISPGAGYTGDVEVTVYLANAGDVSNRLKHLNIEIACTNTTVGTQLLGLDNANIAFPVSGYTTNDIIVSVSGGSYHAYDGISGSIDLRLYCEVSPRGLND